MAPTPRSPGKLKKEEVAVVEAIGDTLHAARVPPCLPKLVGHGRTN